MKRWKPQEYFVYFKAFSVHSCGKRTYVPAAMRFKDAVERNKGVNNIGRNL